MYLNVNNSNSVIKDVEFRNCSTVKSGGGIYSVSSSFTYNFAVINSAFIDCSATLSGGGVYFNNGADDLGFTNVRFENCVAGQSGGGLAVRACLRATLDSCSFDHCAATEVGGGLFVEETTDFLVTYGNFTGNMAAQGGGVGLTLGSVRPAIVSSSFTDNVAYEEGGGIYAQSNHEGLKVIDSNAYWSMTTVESDHPYYSEDAVIDPGGQSATQQVIMSETVTIYDAEELILYFDLLTSFVDTLNIYDNSIDRNLLWRCVDQVPGRLTVCG